MQPTDRQRDEDELRGELHEILIEIENVEGSLRLLKEREAKVRSKLGHHEHERGFTIFVDDQPYHTKDTTLSGAAIKQIASKDAAYQLFEERPGDDRKIADDTSIQIKNDLRFYTVPPATFGWF